MCAIYREKVMVVVVTSMKNPRSALCKTSIMASADIFKAFGDKLLDAFDNLVLTVFIGGYFSHLFV